MSRPKYYRLKVDHLNTQRTLRYQTRISNKAQRLFALASMRHLEFRPICVLYQEEGVRWHRAKPSYHFALLFSIYQLFLKHTSNIHRQLPRQTGSIMPEIRTMDRMCGQQKQACQRPAAAPQQKVYTSDMLPSSPAPKRRRGFRRLFKKKSKAGGVVAT
ncbi:hypothetical protein TcWFU_006745 [Taenia crassiceps]|uniref:Uncharacterized protein n=1 Tax=Taenia crassiceps TaxID=6207 RepID=A0ABR4QSI7_9CEST